MCMPYKHTHTYIIGSTPKQVSRMFKTKMCPPKSNNEDFLQVLS